MILRKIKVIILTLKIKKKKYIALAYSNVGSAIDLHGSNISPYNLYLYCIVCNVLQFIVDKYL